MSLATIGIGLFYGRTTLPYWGPFLPAISTFLSQTNCQYLMYKIYIHGNVSKQNNKVISELFTTTIQSLLLIQLSIGMNSSLHTHVLSTNIFFILSRNIFITLSPQQSFFVIYHYVASLTWKFLIVISKSPWSVFKFMS